MDMVRAFEAAGIKLNIQGTRKEPLFQASQIGKLIGLTNIHVSVHDFDDDEKAVISTKTKYGQQHIMFLKENGVKRLIANSRKPAALALAKTVGVDIFEYNALKCLPQVGSNKLMTMLKQEFGNDHEEFLQDFMPYLYLNSVTDFEIGFDTVIESITFANKDGAKRLLLKNLVEGTHYIIDDSNTMLSVDDSNIILSVDGFKQFCIAAKAMEIHDCYIKMEGVMSEYTKNDIINKLVFPKEYLNKSKLDKIVYDMFDQNANFEQVQSLLDTAQLFMNDFMGKCEEMKKTQGIIQSVANFMEAENAGNSDNAENSQSSISADTNVKMTGVQRCYNGKFAAIIAHEHKTYRLGNFDTMEGAYEQYMKYKTLLNAEKNGGAKVDLTFNARDKKKNPPPPIDEVLPENIILTKNNTYQIIHNKKRIVGTFKTAEQASAAYDVFKSSPPTNEVSVPAAAAATAAAIKDIKTIKDEYKLNMQGTPDEPLFQANHIGKLLGLTNIHETVKHYDDDEKVIMMTTTNRGQQNVLFLNKKGMTHLITHCRKPAAFELAKSLGINKEKKKRASSKKLVK